MLRKCHHLWQFPAQLKNQSNDLPTRQLVCQYFFFQGLVLQTRGNGLASKESQCDYRHTALLRDSTHKRCRQKRV
jgi:hypothetical protein